MCEAEIAQLSVKLSCITTASLPLFYSERLVLIDKFLIELQPGTGLVFVTSRTSLIYIYILTNEEKKY